MLDVSSGFACVHIRNHGNVEEQDYYEKIARFVLSEFSKSARIVVRDESKGQSLRLYVHSKDLVAHLLSVLELNPGPKARRIKIPERFSRWSVAQHIIRGLFETDGSLYFSKINGVAKYPRLDIKSSSLQLIHQVQDILRTQGFRTTRRKCGDSCECVSLNGRSQLQRWVAEIGFSSEKNSTKYAIWKRLGFYMGGSSLEDRRKIMRRWPSG